MGIDLDGKRFRVVSNSDGGDVSEGTIFHYHQEDALVWCNYNGGRIVRGHLLATLTPDGMLDASYHHVNDAGVIMTGVCNTRIEVLPDGKYRLHERWQWTSGDKSKGGSVLEELEVPVIAPLELVLTGDQQ
jgi:hypothetical protein